LSCNQSGDHREPTFSQIWLHTRSEITRKNRICIYFWLLTGTYNKNMAIEILFYFFPPSKSFPYVKINFFFRLKFGENSFTILIYLKKKSQATWWSSELFWNFFGKKTSSFEEESYEIAPRFLKDLGSFLASFFWNRHIWLLGSNGTLTCNRKFFFNLKFFL